MKLTPLFRVSFSQLLLAGLVLMTSACSTNAVRKVNSAATGVVAGNLTIDGTPTRMQYVYALEHVATRVDIDRLGLRHGETIEKDVISVVLANQPLTAEIINDIVGDTTRIPAGLIGLLFTIDPTRGYHWESQFLANAERISLFGYTSSGGDAPRIEVGRIKAKLALTNQDAVHRRGFLLSFDAPLSIEGSAWEHGLLTEYGGSPCGSARFVEAYRKEMPGRWATETWRGESGMMASATLDVRQEIGEKQFLGTLHFVVNEFKLGIDEEVVIDCADSKVHVRGAVIPETRWAADTLVFELQENRLVGTGKDELGQSMQVVLKKIR